MIQGFRATLALMVALGLFVVSNPVSAAVLQCAPYARQISGIQLFGRAANWWDEAAGHYERGQHPEVGAVLAFSSSHSMPAGHVAMVSKVVSDREVLLTHANWSYRGGIEHDVRAIDVSPNNDWTDVKVWFGPIGDLGQRANRAHGFIYGAGHAVPSAPVLIAPVLIAAQIASADMVSPLR